ncbi:MAG: TatD family hydrolase [Sphaerochaeta sp.]
MFDAHRHLTGEREPYDAFYCTSHHDEWEKVANLPLPAIGAIGALANRVLPTLYEMGSMLEAHPLLQIGEVGLDKRFGDLEGQKKFLLGALDLAFSMNRSVTVHVVQSDGFFLSCLDQAGKRLPPVLWHGFKASIETARAAAKHGCILSLGPQIARAKVAYRLEEFSSISFAIETDYEQEKPYLQALEAQYELVGRLMHKDRESLIRNNHAKRAILTNNAPPR